MKFKEWEDFADQINAYGRMGYVKKQSTYNPFTKVNLMIMEHRRRFDEVVFILYPDDESFDRDYDEEAYVPPPTRSEKFLEDLTKQTFTPKIDHRTRDNRSERYPAKPGSPKPKPGPPKRKDEQ